MAEHRLYGNEVTIKFDGRAHAYSWNERGGLFIPGVTKILSRFSKLDALLPWAAGTAADYIESSLLEGSEHLVDYDDITINVGRLKQTCKNAKKAYRRKTKEAADIGKKVHQFAEDWLRGNKPNIPKDAPEPVKLGCQAFVKWVSEHDVKPICPEKVCFSRRWLYAGTCDFFGYVDGELTIGDFKTSKAVYIDHLLQTAAYQVAIEEELGTPIPSRRLIRLDKTTGSFHVERYAHSNLHIDGFLRLREFHEAISKIESSRRF